MQKTTDEKIFSMAYSKMVPMLIGFVLATNTVSLTLQRLSIVEEKSIYDNHANKRRISNAIQELEYKRKIEAFEEKIKYCK
tara:strand:- start:2377 stop:2619 length:243 start_codon:yes stop_codon:yes gene_type:complete